MNQILNNIEKLVKENQIKMIPRWHFVLRTGLVAVCGFLVLLAVVYALSLFIFIARRNAPPTFGMRDVFFNLDVLPMIIIAFAIVGMILIEIWSRKYTFAYRLPSMVLFVCIIFFVSLVSLLVDRMMIHDRMHDIFLRNKMEMFDSVYERPFIRGGMKSGVMMRSEIFVR